MREDRKTGCSPRGSLKPGNTLFLFNFLFPKQPPPFGIHFFLPLLRGCPVDLISSALFREHIAIPDSVRKLAEKKREHAALLLLTDRIFPLQTVHDQLPESFSFLLHYLLLSFAVYGSHCPQGV